VLDADATIALLTTDPARTALLVDFDGSLAPIVERSQDARPLPEAIAQLERLSRRLGRVGVVSGRPVDYLARYVPVENVVLAGLYGMEHVVNGVRAVDPLVMPYLEAISAATEELRARVRPDLVEAKSGVAVTLHWRPAPELADECVAAARDVADRYGLGLLPTRMAIEVRPPVAIDKGDAVRTLIAGFSVGAFAGDDTGDLPAFAALDAAVRDGALEHGVRVGVHSSEVPPELVNAVDILVDGPAGLAALLTRVADQIS
jgi:trehalose 6-phosphate phosphatase